jgi:hypothetical protein
MKSYLSLKNAQFLSVNQSATLFLRNLFHKTNNTFELPFALV